MAEDYPRWQIILIIMIALIFGIAMLAGCQQSDKTKPVKVEGPHITLKLKPLDGSAEISSDTMDKTIAVLKKRLQPLSIDEWQYIPQGKDRLIIGVPAKADMEKVISLAGKRGYLEFREKSDKGEWKPVIDGSVIESARMEFSRQGKSMLTYMVKRDSRVKFAELADRNDYNLIGVYLDGNLIASPPAKTLVLNGIGTISNERMNKEDFEDLIVLLNSGALPAEVEVEK